MSENQNGEIDSVTASEDSSVPEIDIEGSQLAVEFTKGILERMGYDVTVSNHVIPPSDEDDSVSLWIDVRCENATQLTDYRNEGLEAIQMLVQTMWSHQTKSKVRLTIDLNGIKAEHKKRVVRMAERIAERVASAGRPIALEPMIASERRIVHMALRQHPSVFTESTGEGGSRRVVIRPKTAVA
jgi:spoIIIJ-associated protein